MCRPGQCDDVSVEQGWRRVWYIDPMHRTCGFNKNPVASKSCFTKAGAWELCQDDRDIQTPVGCLWVEAAFLPEVSVIRIISHRDMSLKMSLGLWGHKGTSTPPTIALLLWEAPGLCKHASCRHTIPLRYFAVEATKIVH